MKKTASAVILNCIITLSGFSQGFADFNDNGIFYKIIDDKNAAVCSDYRHSYPEDNPGISYSGHIVIPPYATFDGVEYNITSIYSHAFANCQNLEVELPKTIEQIGDYAFYNCGDLKINIPASILRIKDSAFYNSIIIPAETHYFSNIELIDNWGLNGFNGHSIILGPFLWQIGSYAFYNSDIVNLEFMDNPDFSCDIDLNVHSFAFTTIKKIRLPERRLNVSNETFYDCPNLESIIFPNTDYIGHIFDFQTVAPIEGRYTKSNYLITKCPELKEVVVLCPTPPQFYWVGYHKTDVPILDDYSNCVLKVPAGSEDAYRADPVWGKFLSIEGFQPGEYTEINNIDSGATGTSTPEYYNLQGIRVNNPVSGQLYIRRTGSKTEKIILN